MPDTRVVGTGAEVHLSKDQPNFGTGLSVEIYARLSDGRTVRLSPFALVVRELQGFGPKTVWGLLSFREPGRRGFAPGYWKALSDELEGQGITASEEDLAHSPFELAKGDDLAPLLPEQG
jgi:hypothetical protein